MKTRNNFFSVLLIFIFFIFFLVPKTLAESRVIKTSYVDTYTLDHSADVLVNKTIEITNNTALLYVSEFELSFSNDNLLSNLQVFEDLEPANFTQTKLGDRTKIRIKFNRPSIGIGSVKKLSINYDLKGYLNRSGVHYELFVPVSQSSSEEELSSYVIRVLTPTDYPSLGIAKPLVKQMGNGVYQWDDVSHLDNKALYLSFSDKAYYQVTLNYLLVNKSAYSRQMDIALVPDGIMQKSYLEDISPPPNNVYTDRDGNFMATYKVGAGKIQKIIYKGYVELTTQIRPEVAKYWQTHVGKKDKSRYLTAENYWQLSPDILNDEVVASLSKGQEIYHYVIDRLDYDILRINKNLERKGAQWAYLNPNQAVCMEYTDLFVALSREKGIPAREVIGYGKTNSQSILPNSFLGDVLHAWPEIYDSARQIWRPIDPTWEDTSGINYYSSFDLSHISFVYHGVSANQPLPPGVYKLDPKSKDVLVRPSDGIIAQNQEVDAEIVKKPVFIKNKQNNIEVQLLHRGNTIIYEPYLEVKDKKTGTVLSTKKINLLEPLSTHLIKLQINKDKLQTGNGDLQIFVNNKKILEQHYQNVTLPVYLLQTYAFYITLAITFLIIYFFVKWRF